MGTRADRKARIADLRRQQILDAALTVFSRKGFGESTIPDVAREAGVAVGTIYNYFESKRDLLISLITGHVLTEPFVKLLERPPSQDHRGFIRSLMEDRLASLFENADRLLLIFGEIQRDPVLRRQYIDGVLEPALDRLETYLRARVDSAAFRSMNTAVATRALVGLVIGFGIIRAVEAERSPTRDMTAQALADQLSDIMIAGLEAQGEQA